MAWFRIEHRVTGAVQIVASLAGIDLEEWTAVPIKVAPNEHQIVNPDGSLSAAERRHIPTIEERIARLEAVIRT